MQRGARRQFLGHHALAVGEEHLIFDDATDCGSSMRFFDRSSEGFVEVGPDDALCVRARERVTGAALGHELLLSVDEVGVAAVLLDGTRARGERERDQSERRSGLPRAGPQPSARRTRGDGRPLADLGMGARRAAHERAKHYPKDGRPGARGCALAGASGPGQSIQFASRRGDHAQRDALPGPALAHGRDQALARASRAARDRPKATQPGARRSHRQSGRRPGTTASPPPLGDRGGEHIADLDQP